MTERIGICDTDQHYGLRFLEYVQNSDFNYEICLFTNRESLYEYLESNDMDHLFLEEELYEEDIHRYHIKMIYMLISHPEIRGDVDYNEVFKYQPVDEILKVLSKKKMNKALSLKITTLYTINPSILSLAFGWSYALSSAKHRKVLFIPLDFFPVPILTSQSKDITGISDIIYYLKDNKSDQSVRWKKLISNMDYLDYIGGANHGFDLLTLSEEDMEKWVSAFYGMKEYEEIVFFFNVTTPAMYHLLSLSTYVYHLKVHQPYEIKREIEWRRQSALMRKGMEPIEEEEVYLMEDNIFDEKVSVTLQELYETKVWKQARDYVKKEGQSGVDTTSS